MKIESLKARDVKHLIDRQDFLSGPVIPVTRHRAESQLLNPDLEEEDVILNIARDDQDRIIGFIGALPGNLGDKGRFAWNSGWWVDPVSGREAAMPLFYKFLEQWDMRVMFSDLTPQTYKILNRMSFIRTFKRDGIRLYYRSVLSGLLTQKSPALKRFRWLFSGIDFLVNLFVAVYGLVWKLAGEKYSSPDTEITDIREIKDNKDDDKDNDREIEELISSSRDSKSIPRGIKRLTWIMAHPWILRDKLDQQQEKYPFSSFDRDFDQKLIIIDSREGTGKAFIMVTIHGRHLKIPYVYYTGDNMLPGAASFLNRLAVSRRVSILSSYHPGLAKALWDVRGPVLYRKTITRYTACSEDLYKISGDGFVFQDGDGDAVFT